MYNRDGLSELLFGKPKDFGEIKDYKKFIEKYDEHMIKRDAKKIEGLIREIPFEKNRKLNSDGFFLDWWKKYPEEEKKRSDNLFYKKMKEILKKIE